MFVFLISLTFLALPFLASTGVAHPGHSHEIRSPLPETWFHPRGHPVHSLFRRQTGSGPPTDGITYPQVGTPTWAAAYPASTPDANAMPQAWKDALSAAVQAGKIPNIPPSSDPNNANPVYPSGYDPYSPQVCSATYKCRIAGDVWDAPQGVIGISFDDGPLPPSEKLYAFLQANNVKATHFFIGVNIIDNPQTFLRAFVTNQDDIAVHTWTHPHMTTLSNEDVVAQLAWTMELIHNSTGGRVPRFWRPPFGDTDLRVSAIAKEVLGLTTVIWNQDTEDWTLTPNATSNGTTPAQIHANMQTWLTGPKTPGLIILEHELSDESVQAFIDNYPLIGANSWKPVSVVQLDGLNAPYQNAQGTNGTVAPSDIVDHTLPFPPASTVPKTTPTSTTSLSTTTSSTSSAASTLATPDNSAKSNGAGSAPNSVSAVLTLTMTVLAGILVSQF
ncbi:carbohydrate esterase family 4 protein [Lactarius psammicola]|nr:carbohydrate esterase family 4 protein [Lactarius psammicola]